MVSARTMDMAMVHLFGRCIADLGDLYIKMQGYAGHRVIAIEEDFIVTDFKDLDAHRSVPALGLKLHARLYIVNPPEGAARG